MKLAISSPIFSLIRFNDILEEISNHFNGWEIIAEGKHFLWDIEKDFREYIPSCSLKHISVHAPFSDINIGSMNTEILNVCISQIERTIEIMNKLDISLLVLHPGFISPLASLIPDKTTEITKKGLHKIYKKSVDCNVSITLENMPKQKQTICQTLKEIISLIDDMEIQICFDVGHANLTGEMDNFLEYGRFGNVHIHDNLGKEDEHLVIGDGNIDFKKVFKIISTNYKGYVVIESRTLEEGIKSKERIKNLTLAVSE